MRGARGRFLFWYDGIMNEHLEKARAALEREGRFVPGRAPKPEDVLEAVKQMLTYLEEKDGKPVITVNSQPVG